MKQLWVVVLVALLLVPSALAVEWNDLPVRNIYDPSTRENEPIRDYSFWELDALLDNPKFQQWNDMNRVCDAMYVLFGRVGHACPQVSVRYSQTPTEPAWVRAYVPPGGYPVYPSAPQRVVYVGPPPWAYPPIPPPCLYPHRYSWR